MILLNTTFAVDQTAERDFINWIKQEYIPELRANESFSDILFTKIVIPPSSEVQTPSYALHFKAPSEEVASNWIETCGARIFSSINSRHKDKVFPFITVLEIL